ncbi:hypothetical protein J7J74_01270 [bacterium]|nr:hypothetical protein [bacterium]
MSKVISIPKELSKKGDLVIIPRAEYEELLDLKKIVRLMKLTPSEKKALRLGRKEIKEGKYITLKQLKSELGS